MAKPNYNLAMFIGATIIATLAILFPASHAIPPSAQSSSTSVSPRSGLWSASADFGVFKFTVNPKATAITKMLLDFSRFKCGSISISSGKISVESQWPVNCNQFKVTVNLGLYKLVVRGKFDDTGTHAAGTWEIESIGAICSGTWESDRGNPKNTSDQKR